MSDYHFSIFGAIIGFLLVLYTRARMQKKSLEDFIDGVFLAFIISASIWYVGAFFGGQVYGLETHFWIEILYTHPFTPVPYKVPIFPLPVFYAVVSFIIFCIFYTSHMFTQRKWLIGYFGLISFSASVIVLDTFSGKYDALQGMLGIHFSQLFAFFLIAACSYKLYRVIQQDSADATLQK